MLGNVWEWVQDTWHDSYSGAPTNGSAWGGGGSGRALRGGSWNDEPQFVRAALRNGSGPAARSNIVGFRLARTLP